MATLQHLPRRPVWRRLLAGLLTFTLTSTLVAPAMAACSTGTSGIIYLTFDTGSQSQAELIADTLKKHNIKATFFMANEKTVNGDYTLDPTWAPFWKRLLADGHAFGTHTFDHVYWQRDLPGGKFLVKPQFGANAGHLETWTAPQYCAELNRVADRFHQLTGGQIDHFWRAPGGKVSPALLAAGASCGYAHAGWSPAGFSGDELPSEKWPNALLLQRTLKGLKDGDIVMAHLGIWSRKDPWAPAVLEPLISGLEQKGFCFATLRDRPDFKHYAVQASAAAQ